MRFWILAACFFALPLVSVILLSPWPWLMVAYLWAFTLFIAIPLKHKIEPWDKLSLIYYLVICALVTTYVAIRLEIG